MLGLVHDQPHWVSGPLGQRAEGVRQCQAVRGADPFEVEGGPAAATSLRGSLRTKTTDPSRRLVEPRSEHSASSLTVVTLHKFFQALKAWDDGLCGGQFRSLGGDRADCYRRFGCFLHDLKYADIFLRLKGDDWRATS